MVGNESFVRKGTFVSVWDGHIQIQTDCKVNTKTGEIFDIERVDPPLSLEHLDREFVLLDDIAFPAMALSANEGDKNNLSYWYQL